MFDEELKKNIEKCSRCALCIQSCPIFKIKQDENNTARGLICKLNGFEKGILSEKEIKKDLKICMNCSKCKKNCPSKINTTFVFSYKNAFLSPSKINQAIFLKLKLLPIKFLYFINFFKKNKEIEINSNVVYFKGCISKAQHKKTFLDYILKNPNFDCCGLPYLTAGDLAQYEKVKKKNIELIKNSSKVIFDCASCKSAVCDYSELNEKEKEKLIFFSDFIELTKYKLKENSKYKNKTITIHKPCHIDESDFKKIEDFLVNLKNIKYKRMDEIDSCCGFGGSYFIFHPITAIKIALKKALHIKNTSAELILSVCPSCVLGLRFGQLISFNFKKTLELRDFIEKECEIK